VYDIERIRALIRTGQFIVFKHLVSEFLKEGLDPDYATTGVLNGTIIEEYPERDRLLIAGRSVEKMPVHIVCDLSVEELVILVTGYIPDSQQWFGTRRRKPKR
jgi:hypothetical protein